MAIQNTNISSNLFRYINSLLLGIVCYFLFGLLNQIKDIQQTQVEIQKSISVYEVKHLYTIKDITDIKNRISILEQKINQKK